MKMGPRRWKSWLLRRSKRMRGESIRKRLTAKVRNKNKVIKRRRLLECRSKRMLLSEESSEEDKEVKEESSVEKPKEKESKKKDKGEEKWV